MAKYDHSLDDETNNSSEIDPRRPSPETFIAFLDQPLSRGNDRAKLERYLQTQLQARQELVSLIELLFSQGEVTQDQFTDYLKEAHYIAVHGKDGDLHTRPDDVAHAGEFRSGYYYSKMPEDTVNMLYSETEKRGLRICLSPEVVRLRYFTNFLNRQNSTGYTNSEFVHNYPEAGFIKKYMKVATELFNEFAKINQYDQEKIVRKVANLHQVFAVSHPFEAVNQSLAMNLANALLESRGIKGIPHGITDAVAFSVSPEDYETYFLDIVLGSGRIN